jgi:ribosomal protein S16
VKLNHERIAYWMKNGAQPSDTVSRLLKKNPAPAAGCGLAQPAQRPTKRRHRASKNHHHNPLFFRCGIHGVHDK